VFTPTIDLGRSGGPKNVVEKDIANDSASITWTAKHHEKRARRSVKCGRLDRRAQESMRELASPMVHMSASLIDHSWWGNILRPGHGKGPEIWDVCKGVNIRFTQIS
jgi:hypothetical protein